MRPQIISASLLVLTLLAVFWLSTCSRVPAKIRTIVEHRAGQHKVIKWVSDQKAAKYMAVLSNGALIEIGKNGDWQQTSSPIIQNHLPSAVFSTIQQYLKNGFEADSFLIIEDPIYGKYYEIDITSDHQYIILSIDTSGKVFKKDFF